MKKTYIIKILGFLVAVLLSSTISTAQNLLKHESSQSIVGGFTSGNHRFSKQLMKSAQGIPTTYWISPKIQVPLKNVTPFLSFSTRWEGNGMDTDDYTLELRSSVDGGKHWSKWTSYDFDHHMAPTPEMVVTQLKSLSAKTTHIQLRVASDKVANTRVTQIHYFFYSPGETPSEVIELTKQIEAKQMAAKASCNKPTFISRGSWGARRPKNNPSTTIAKHLFVHHSVSDSPSGNWPALVRSIQNFHMDNQGWSDIGYNALVAPNGVIYEGRAGGDRVQGAHICGFNSGTYAVCVLGNYDENVRPTQASLNSVGRVLGWKAEKEGIDPKGRSHKSGVGTINNISGHRDLNGHKGAGCRNPTSTACPGKNLHARLNTIRDLAANCGGCPSNLDLTSTISSGVYTASGTITASATVANGASVVFDAKNTILLNAGFAADSGANTSFTAKIGEGCTSARAVAAATTLEEFPVIDPEFSITKAKPVVEIYPNPASGMVNISFTLSNSENVTIKLFNATGRLVNRSTTDKRYEAGKHTITLNVGSYPKGVYFCAFTNQGTTLTKKIVLR